MMAVPNPVFLSSLGWACDRFGLWTHPATPGEFDEMTAMEVTRRAMTNYRLNQNPDWLPDPIDLEWQERLVSQMGERTEWRPASGDGCWKIFKPEKTAILAEGDPEHIINKRIAMVFVAMGWGVGFGDQLRGSDVG